MKVYRRGPDRRWWYESWKGPSGPHIGVVAESRPYWAKEPLRAPEPALSGSVGLAQPNGVHNWLDQIWERPEARRAR